MRSNKILSDLRLFLNTFEESYESDDLRTKVQSLVPVFLQVRKLGTSLIPNGLKISARNRLLIYFKKYPKVIINEHELALVAGISEWARRVRELRVQFGWKIMSGVTFSEMIKDSNFFDYDYDFQKINVNDYILIDTKQDKEMAFRWNLANEIRRKNDSVQNKILLLLRKNIGKEVTGEELRYVSKGKTEWARRVRELRTEKGWPITTKNTGRPELPVGVYLLEEDRQAPEHDRHISEKIRVEVLKRDNYSCVKCKWHISEWNKADPRFLELHHIKEHAKGGKNDSNNLITVCNICHDEIHKNINN